MDLTEMWCDDFDCIHLAQERVGWWAVIELCNEPSGSPKSR